MYHADEMPQVEWGLLEVTALEAGLWQITVEVTNDKMIPTILAHARKKRIGARDVIECDAGEGAEVVASGTVSSFLPDARFDAVERDPQRIWNAGGVGGKGRDLFRFLVAGSGAVELAYASQKGGTIMKTVELAEKPLDFEAEIPGRED